MNRIGVLAVLVAGTALFACSGPTPPPGDAGFFGTGTGGTYGGGNFYGTGGSSATGGASGGGNPSEQGEDGGREEERRGDGGGPPGGRHRDPGPTPDAAPIAGCRAGTMSGAACMMADATCLVTAGDGGRGEVCSCRIRGGEGTWRCNTP